MFKRITSLILLFLLTISIGSTKLVCLADSVDLTERNLILNGDMEWLGTSYKIWSGTHEPETAIVHSGKKSMKLSFTDSRLMYTQDFSGVLPGQTYTLEFWVYAESLISSTSNWQGGASVKIDFAGIKVDASGNETATSVAEIFELNPIQESELGTWVKRTVSLTAPADTATKYITGTGSVYIRPQGTGTVWYDDLSFTGPITAEDASSLDAKKARYQEGYNVGQSLYDEYVNYAEFAELAPGAKNLLKNNSFETPDDSGKLKTNAANWRRSNYLANNISRFPNCTKDDYEVIIADSTTAKSGNTSLKVHRPAGFPNGLGDPNGYQNVTSGTAASQCGEVFVPGADYILSAWVKTEDVPVGGGAYFSIGGISFASPKVRFTDGEWHYIKCVFTMPENVSQISVYVRISGAGTVWYDDVTFGRSSTNNYFDLNSKHTFYYSDEPEVETWTDFNASVFNVDSGSKMKFSLLDENGSLISSNEVAATEKNTWTFPASLLTNKKTKYILNAEYMLADGTVVDSHTKNIYLYDRPTSMDTDGNLHDTETGEVIPPFFMYAVNLDYYDGIEDSGIKFIRTRSMSATEESMRQHLDEAHSRGVKLLVALYSNIVAGHPEQIETTRHLVSTFKDHPAVGAWMMMDEPSLHIESLGIRTYEEMLYYLEEGYKTIRDIDPVHPVFNIETVGQVPDSYEQTSQMCDIFAIDPYPSSLSSSISGSLSQATTRAINAVHNERPVWVLGLAADWTGNYGHPVNSSMLRYQLYDALWTGAKGAGHYLSDSADFTNPTFSETYVNTFTKAKESGEIDEIFDHFSLGNSSTWAEGTGNGYEWQSWKKANGDIYIAVRSRISDEDTVINSLVTDINLISKNGDMSIDGYDAVLINGVSEPTISSLTDNFCCTITKGEVSLYKITPKTGYTLSNLQTSSTETSVTVEYDVAKHITEEGGIIIYAFYDLLGRFVKMEKEDAAFDNIHMTRTFDKADFASMKVFIWDSLGGMIPFSNVIE
ncbi:MAG: hypothetical protein IKC41_04115 [Clostridia bacterium]|nr:hypothetical protein [Clostridia bacterium]